VQLKELLVSFLYDLPEFGGKCIFLMLNKSFRFRINLLSFFIDNAEEA